MTKVEDPTVKPRLYVKDANGIKYFEKEIDNTNYTEHTVQFSTLENDNVAQIGFWRPNNAVGSAYLDNIHLSIDSSNNREDILLNLDQGEDKFSIYPNPATHQVNIKASNSSQMNVVELYNIIGKKNYNTSFSILYNASNRSFTKRYLYYFYHQRRCRACS